KNLGRRNDHGRCRTTTLMITHCNVNGLLGAVTLTFMLGGCLLPSVPVDGSDDDPGAQDATDDDTDEPGDTNDNSDAADSNDTGQAFTCDDLAADYAALMAINE